MNNPIKYLYLIPAGIVICTILSVISSCSADDNPPGNNLPAGKYPMTFTTSVGELVVTRGTADNSQWAGTEKVAIQLGNDATSYGEIKEYKAATGGELTPANTADPLYWRNTTETVTAWYPYSTARPTSFTVQENQDTGDNYQASDFLYTTGTHTYNSNGACALVFKHLPTKVVINLKGDPNGGITEDEIKGATVSIVNQSLISGTIGDDGIVAAAAAAGTADITPKELPAAADGYQRSVQALLIPQVVRFTKFIKVTIDGNNYYYTPTDAVLNSGSQSTYNITVKKDGLEVSTLSGSWTDDDQSTSITPGAATFKIYLSNLKVESGITTAKVTDDSNQELNANNGVYTTSSKTVKIVYTVNNDYDLWNFTPEVKEGFCTPKGVAQNGNDYTYTLTDICTDVWLSDIEPTTQLKQVKVGDYYYSDGTWSTDYKTDKTCIGIVFYAGVGTGDQASNYGGSIASTKIHGYVVALKDAHADPGAWGTRLVDENKAGRNSRSTTDYDGYSNTTHIRNIGDDYNNTDVGEPLKNSQYWAFKVASVYQPVSTITPAAPTSSSGWYLPSYAQINAVCRLNMDTQLTTTGGTKLSAHTGNYRYWSSTEYSEYNAYYYSSYTDTHKPSNQYAKSNDLNEIEQENPDKYNYLNDSKSYVRAILTF